MTGWGGDVGLLTLISRDFCFSSLNFMAISVMSFLYSVSNFFGSKYFDGLKLLSAFYFRPLRGFFFISSLYVPHFQML